MYRGLSAEFSFDGLYGKTAGFLTAITASLTYGLVNEDAHGWLGRLASFSVTTEFCCAGLVVDEDGASGNIAQNSLGLIQAISMPNFGTVSEVGRDPILFGVVGKHHDFRGAFGFEGSSEFGDFHATVNLLAARHGYSRVVKNLESDVRSSGNRLSDSERSRVVKSTVTDVLKAVLHVDEWSCTDPLHAFAAHLGGAFDVARRSHGSHAVAADSASGFGTFWNPRGSVVWTA